MAEDNLKTKLTMLNDYVKVEKPSELERTFPALIIADLSNRTSIVGARTVINSILKTNSSLSPLIVQATTPETLDRDMNHLDLSINDWNYPESGQVKHDLKTGLKLTGYAAKDQRKVIACAVSHLRCWVTLKFLGGGVVFEHDAVVKRKISPSLLEFPQHGIVGLNDPRGATRRSMLFHERVVDNVDKVFPHVYDNEGTRFRISSVPWVDQDHSVPQGLAGNSAYFISQQKASKMISLVKEYGLWPNDAIMCKQLIECKQVFPYMTGLQRIQSTTTG